MIILNENSFHEVRHLPKAASYVMHSIWVKRGLWIRV
jgi:hypothetical protein